MGEEKNRGRSLGKGGEDFFEVPEGGGREQGLTRNGAWVEAVGMGWLRERGLVSWSPGSLGLGS